MPTSAPARRKAATTTGSWPTSAPPPRSWQRATTTDSFSVNKPATAKATSAARRSPTRSSGCGAATPRPDTPTIRTPRIDSAAQYGSPFFETTSTAGGQRLSLEMGDVDRLSSCADRFEESQSGHGHAYFPGRVVEEGEREVAAPGTE